MNDLLKQALDDGYIVAKNPELQAMWKEKCRREEIPYIVVIPTSGDFADVELSITYPELTAEELARLPVSPPFTFTGNSMGCCLENLPKEVAVELAQKWARSNVNGRV